MNSSGALLAVSRDAPRAVATNVLPELSSFVGRAAELADARALLDGPARLVTLVGLAGAGKTRLARAVALSYLSEADASVPALSELWWCDLSTATDEADLLSALALTLGIALELRRGDEEAAREHLARALAGRGRVLLVLDNFEQLTAHASLLGTLLRGAPATRILVTSRVALDVAGEHRLELGPLASVEDAVQLFLDRARARRPDVGAEGEARAAIAQCVELLDRLPLAIELAAALTSLYDTPALVRRLERGYDVLRSSDHDSPERHGSLHRALASSWERLEAAQQRALVSCAVFDGGFDIEAGEAVVGAGMRGVEDIGRLVASSLVRREAREDGHVRLALYLGVREFVRSQAEADVLCDAARRHLHHFGDCAARWTAHLVSGAASAELHHTLARERANLRAALAVAITLDEPAHDALRAALHCAHALALDACHREGMRRVRAIVAPVLALLARRSAGAVCATLLDDAHAPLDPAALRSALDDGCLATLSDLLVVAAQAGAAAAKHAAATALLDRAQGLAEVLADVRRVGRIAHERALVLRNLGELDAARRCAEEALERFESVGDASAAAYARSTLAILAHTRGELDAAEPLYLAALRDARELGIELLAAFVGGQLAGIAWRRGRAVEARRRLRETLAVQRRYADHRGEATTQGALAVMEMAVGELDAARAHNTACIELHMRLGQSMPLGVAHRQRCMLETLTGALDAAHEHLVLARSLLEPRGGLRARVWLCCNDVQLRLAEGDLEGALRSLQATLSAAGEAPLAAVWDLHFGAVAVAGLLGRHALAEAHLAALGGDDALRLDHTRRALEHLAPAFVALADEATPARDETLVEGFASAFASSPQRVTPDHSHELRQWVAALERALPEALREMAWAQALDPHGRAIVVTQDGERLRLPGVGWVELGRRRTVARLLEALIAHHRAAPAGALLEREALIEAGWPGERILPEAAHNRLHKTLSMIRSLGLRDHLELVETGYRLSPGLELVDVPTRFDAWWQAQRRGARDGAVLHVMRPEAQKVSESKWV